MRMRLPLAPATLRAGGRISAGMISVVQIPLPIRAAMEPRDCPQRCAPSPESLMISTICSFSVLTACLLAGALVCLPVFLAGFWIVVWFMIFPLMLQCALAARAEAPRLYD